MEWLHISIIYLIGLIAGLIIGRSFLSKSSQTIADSAEYLLDDMEVFFVNGSRELIHDVAQVEVGENFIIMLDRESNIKAIIPNREIEHINVLERT